MACANIIICVIGIMGIKHVTWVSSLNISSRKWFSRLKPFRVFIVRYYSFYYGIPLSTNNYKVFMYGIPRSTNNYKVLYRAKKQNAIKIDD